MQVNKDRKDDTVAMHAKDPLTSDLSEGKIDVKATKEYGCNSKRRCRRGKDFENGGRATPDRTGQCLEQSTMIRTRMTLIGALKELKYGAWIRDVEAIAPWLT